MAGKQLIAVAALLGAMTGFSASATAADAAKPNPPSQLCVNEQCVKTAAPTAASTTHMIKWNPGHYMASDSVIYAGKTLSTLQAEMDDLNNQDAILGYRVYISWGALEPTKGNYDFSVLDSILTRLKTAYNKPKRMVIYLWLYGQGALVGGDGRVFPAYIQQDPAYGASPVAGSYGWWGANANGKSTGMFAPALYTQPVMDRVIALVQALGQHYDGDPYVEALDYQEDATVAEAAGAFGPPDPRYSDAGWSTQLKRLLTASTAAFPHTSIIMDNSWFDRPPPGVDLQQWMVTNRIAPGTADSWGQTGIAANGTSHLSDGIQTLLGTSQYGGNVDLRPKTRPMLAVEGTEMDGKYFSKYGGPWTPQDIANAMNTTYWASHVFWTHFFGNEKFTVPVPIEAKWSNLAATVAATPLVHIEYPENYP